MTPSQQRFLLLKFGDFDVLLKDLNLVLKLIFERFVFLADLEIVVFVFWGQFGKLRKKRRLPQIKVGRDLSMGGEFARNDGFQLDCGLGLRLGAHAKLQERRLGDVLSCGLCAAAFYDVTVIPDRDVD